MLRTLAILMTLSLVPAQLPANDFDWLVREFSRETGAKQMHIPFMGFARFVVAVGHPAGATDFKLAIFERGGFESQRFSSLTDSTVGGSWKPMILVRSTKGESTNIYARPDRKHVGLLITTLNGDTATFVQVQIKPDALIRFVDEHRQPHRNGSER